MTDLVALLTDFGHTDPYVGIMKAVMLNANPEMRFIDLCHECRPQSLESAAYMLLSAWPYLPDRTVVLAVVDPGVGSKREELIGRGGSKYFVGPDNGIISLLHRFKLLSSYHRADPVVRARITAGSKQSHTFHGRDLFAPLAVELTRNGGVIGERISPVLLGVTSIAEPGGLSGRIIHIDHFGNVITSIHRSDVATDVSIESMAVSGDSGEEYVFNNFGRFYAQADEGGSIIYWGSSGFLELGTRNGNAAESFHLHIGDRVEVSVADADTTRLRSVGT